MADANALTTRESCDSAAQALERLAPLIVAGCYRDAAAAFNEVIYDELLAVTPEQDPNESGGYYGEPGSLKESLDSGIVIDSNLQGVQAGVGYGKQDFIARLVDAGHQLVRNGRIVGAAEPHPFLRQTVDGSMDKAIGAFAEVLEQKIPGLKP